MKTKLLLLAVIVGGGMADDPKPVGHTRDVIAESSPYGVEGKIIRRHSGFLEAMTKEQMEQLEREAKERAASSGVEYLGQTLDANTVMTMTPRCVTIHPSGEMELLFSQKESGTAPSKYVTGLYAGIYMPRAEYKLIVGVKNGKLAVLRRIDAKIIPAQPERVEWPEEKP